MADDCTTRVEPESTAAMPELWIIVTCWERTMSMFLLTPVLNSPRVVIAFCYTSTFSSVPCRHTHIGGL
jgi:hypothetical protein